MNKKSKLFFLVLLSTSFQTFSQPESNVLNKADSLFTAHKFTQSFELFDSIYRQKKASPAMLLKMAYIKEGLGDFTLAQYYLNEYYLATNNDLALTKMEKLAKEKELVGYETNDLNFIRSLYYKHFQWLVIGIFFVTLTLFAFFIIQLKKFNKTPPVTSFFMLSALIGLFLLINFGKDYNEALIIKNNTFVMAGPSAGADVLDIINKGNKIEINREQDVWLQIEWQGKKGYIKNNNVRRLSVW
ncbi:MAG: hypothetical protein L3J06_00925 [Cyclobacteriaceae bacterium]|nr:hypothetical protein [Cyclobacteriaceae bacterium]